MRSGLRSRACSIRGSLRGITTADRTKKTGIRLSAFGQTALQRTSQKKTTSTLLFENASLRGRQAECRVPTAYFLNKFLATNRAFAGRSANLRMKYGYHSVPNGMYTR